MRRVAAVALPLLLTAGCASGQADRSPTGATRFVAGDGKVTVFEPADRRKAPDLAEERLGGGTLATAGFRGKVQVLNF